MPVPVWALLGSMKMHSVFSKYKKPTETTLRYHVMLFALTQDNWTERSLWTQGVQNHPSFSQVCVRKEMCCLQGTLALACVLAAACLCPDTFPEWKGFGCSSPAFKGVQTESSSPELHKVNLLLEMSVSMARAGRLLPDRLTRQVKSLG